MRPARARRTATWGRLELLCGTRERPWRAAGHPQRRRGGGGFLAHLCLDLGGQRRVLAKVVANVVATLTETLVPERHPRPALLEDPVLDRGVDQRPLARDAFV